MYVFFCLLQFLGGSVHAVTYEDFAELLLSLV